MSKEFLHEHVQAGPDRILPAEDHRAWDPAAPVKLRLADSGPGAIQPISIPTLFRKQVSGAQSACDSCVPLPPFPAVKVEAIPDNKALQALGRQGEDIQWTWTQYHEEVSVLFTHSQWLHLFLWQVSPLPWLRCGLQPRAS